MVRFVFVIVVSSPPAVKEDSIIFIYYSKFHSWRRLTLAILYITWNYKLHMYISLWNICTVWKYWRIIGNTRFDFISSTWWTFTLIFRYWFKTNKAGPHSGWFSLVIHDWDYNPAVRESVVRITSVSLLISYSYTGDWIG